SKDSTTLLTYISSKPYVKSIEFVNKDKAKEIFMADGNKSWDGILDANPLPNSINFKVKQEYMNADSLKIIQADLLKQTYVSEVAYPQALVDNLNKNIRRISVILLTVALLLSAVVIALIDNTIRLAMFSNRFLIKTMQMVGATRWFIAWPMNQKAIINGAVSGGIASAAVFAFVKIAENILPELKAIRDLTSLSLLFVALILLGIGITLFSTHRSVIKYLKMKLDELY
ncbi:MAG: hypothetical protein EBR19_07915, partial [Chitinophagaceae bacterium]|nr:hypothetical protein [Chitinophagaceae bacterium]